MSQLQTLAPLLHENNTNDKVFIKYMHTYTLDKEFDSKTNFCKKMSSKMHIRHCF